MGRQRDTAEAPRTLWIVLDALRGRRIRVELRNGRYVEGVLDYVDHSMNTMWSEALVDEDGRGEWEPILEAMFIPGRQIVMVSIPNDFKVEYQVDAHVNRVAESRRVRQTRRRPIDRGHPQPQEEVTQRDLTVPSFGQGSR